MTTFKMITVLFLTATVMTFSTKAIVAADGTEKLEKQVDDGWEMASALDVKGKGGWTTCGVFALDLQRRFTLAGGESHIIVYDWTDSAGFGDRHALFVFRDAQGHYWGIDNRHLEPLWLAGTTPAEWVASWEPDKVSLHLVADVNHPKLAGRTADKSRYDRLTAQRSLDQPTQ
ncbi:hypothetical protein SAMN05444156_0792 [Verrucomicrobium sp. GAS474]|uniref:hypothetical protein n=1 Tax=Verrucomicrobium sp. GAS474 TaxID=1882831 RepID=UPI00087A3B74|nr:hypothetical protein [Verrucomicrobium sp. GAS474]SDT92483.1 hypothetical protein SAMN05444156_0792 [Verrucomicrobium sp. GAS474]